MVKGWIFDLMALLGLCLFAKGLDLIYAPSVYLFAGVILLWCALRGTKRIGNK